MNNEHTHIKEYNMYARTVIILLALTALNITVAGFKHIPYIPVIIMILSCIQAYIALAWLMHLKFDNRLFRFLTIGVFFLFFITIVILFLDYKLR